MPSMLILRFLNARSGWIARSTCERFVSRIDRVPERRLDVHPRALCTGQRTHVFRQAGAAEGEAGTQIPRRDVELRVAAHQVHDCAVELEPRLCAIIPISFANEILSAWNALQTYFTISATSKLGAGYRRIETLGSRTSSSARVRSSLAAITIFGGW